jgi:hypothetical protein
MTRASHSLTHSLTHTHSLIHSLTPVRACGNAQEKLFTDYRIESLANNSILFEASTDRTGSLPARLPACLLACLSV